MPMMDPNFWQEPRRLVWAAFLLAFGMASHLASAQSRAYNESSIIDLNLRFWPKTTAPNDSLEAELKTLGQLSIKAREERFLRYWQDGVYPEFLRHLQAVNLEGKGHRLTIWVAPDYFSLGSDRAPILIPLSFINAAKLSRSADFMLPTAKLVDAIYQAASRKIWPKHFSPTPDMVGINRLLEHNHWVQGQKGLNVDPDGLTAGHKKDLVLSQRLAHHQHNLAIYGWQDLEMGSPIQPLSIWHHAEYVDYSHGIRLIGAWGVLDGQLLRLDQILRHRDLSSLLSYEGPLNVRALLQPLAAKTW